MSPESQISFRLAVVACSLFLGVQAAWLILPEIYRPRQVSWSENPAGAENARQRGAAKRAAALGIMRGDLWAALALTYRNIVAPNGMRQPATGDELQEARSIARRALTMSPHDARVWLLLAGIEARTEEGTRRPNDRAAAALKMAYYTGQNDLELAPVRLMVAVRPGVLADREVQQLVRDELSAIISSRAEIKSAVVAAYRQATPQAKSLIEEVVSVQDPDLLKSARSDAGMR